MCLSPVTLINPSKFLNLQRKDRYLLHVPCGHCAECQTNLSNQWLYRTYREFEDCIKNKGFVYFDSLTYDNAHLPSVREIFCDFPDDFPIFNSNHTHKFLDALDKRLERRYKSSFRYFLSSEYGEKKGRPHYHILLFVYGDINPVELSSEIADLWKYGRTDGYPYKSRQYVMQHNTITENNTETLVRTANYVTKYVQKSCKYDGLLYSRVACLLDWYASSLVHVGCVDNVSDFLSCSHSKVVRSMLKRRINQFHRQSQQFGASALDDIDLLQLAKHGVLFMPHYKYVKLAVPIPMYYKRKLFQEQVVVDGMRIWQKTDLGNWFDEQRKPFLRKQVNDRYRAASLQYGFEFDSKIADYILDERGRFRANGEPSKNLRDRLEHVDLFNYASRADMIRFDKLIVSDKYFGNSSKGYTHRRGRRISHKDFVSKLVIMDSRFEDIIESYETNIREINKGKQNLFALKQRLRQVLCKDLNSCG